MQQFHQTVASSSTRSRTKRVAPDPETDSEDMAEGEEVPTKPRVRIAHFFIQTKINQHKQTTARMSIMAFLADESE